MKLALHRSVTFWSGILVMAFICWAWKNSRENESELQWKVVTVTSHDSIVTIDWSERWDADLQLKHEHRARDPFLNDWLPAPFFRRGGEAPPFTLSDEELGVQHYRNRPLPERITRRNMALWEIQNYREDIWYTYLPYWLLLLSVALPWSVLLIQRAKRRNKAAETTPLLRGSTQT